MAANEDPMVDKLREVVEGVKSLRNEREEALAEAQGEKEKASDLMTRLEEAEAQAAQYDSLVEKVKDHERGLCTLSELMHFMNPVYR